MTPLMPARIEAEWHRCRPVDPEGCVSFSGQLLLCAAREHGRSGGECPFEVPELREAWATGAAAASGYPDRIPAVVDEAPTRQPRTCWTCQYAPPDPHDSCLHPSPAAEVDPWCHAHLDHDGLPTHTAPPCPGFKGQDLP